MAKAFWGMKKKEEEKPNKNFTMECLYKKMIALR